MLIATQNLLVTNPNITWINLIHIYYQILIIED